MPAVGPLPGPVSEDERILALDIVRGLALFGVLMVNLLTEFRVSLFEYYFAPPKVTSSADRIVARVLAVAIESKAFVLFSLLFGVGLAIHQERLDRRGVSSVTVVVRRLSALLAIGLVHLFLVWNGDILTEYAIAGFVVLPILHLSKRRAALVPVAALAFLALYLSPWPGMVPPTFHGWLDGEALDRHIEDARRIYGTGSFVDMLRFRIHEVRFIAALLVVVLPRTIALFLVGAVAVRLGLIARAAEHRTSFRWIAAIGISLGFGVTLLPLVASAWVERAGRLGSIVSDLAPVVLGLGYAAALMLVLLHPRARRVLSVVAPLGRMALTNYVAQSMLFGLVFYGYGLGLFGRPSMATTAMFGVVVYAAQALTSAWWLRRFRFGPLEWCWRAMTYGVMPPMRGGAR